jgi:cell division protein FtsB
MNVLEKVHNLETELQAVRSENTQLQQLNKVLKDHEAKLEKGSIEKQPFRQRNHFVNDDINSLTLTIY